MKTEPVTNITENMPFIHPEILLTVGKNVDPNKETTLDPAKFQEAKNKGRESANDILKKLFNKVEYGKIESHFNTERLNSKNFESIREQIVNLYFQREVITNEANKFSQNYERIRAQYFKTSNSFFKFLLKKKIQKLTDQLVDSKNDLESVKKVEEESYLSIKCVYETNEFKEKYSDLISSFTTLKNSDVIWDMTYSEANTETKAAAQTSMRRNKVAFTFKSIPSIQTTEKNFYFENFNGGDFYFYSSFIIYFKSEEDIAILDYNDLQLHYSEARFLEETKDIASDTEIVGETWYRVNKDGSPDKRFVGNYKIPIVLYGSIHIRTESGINELYYTSDFKKAKHFCEQYNLYQSLL
jgi:hypothetical protein